MSASAAPLFTEEHQRAICEACEKLWNGLPPENPIYAPRPEGHPLRIVANKAHEALNAALAMETQYLQAAAQLAAAETALAVAQDALERIHSETRDSGDDPGILCFSIYVTARDALEKLGVLPTPRP